MHHLVTLATHNLLNFINLHYNLIFISSITCLTLLTIKMLLSITKIPSKNIFIVDFSCYKAPTSQMLTKKMVLKRFKLYGNLSETNSIFLQKMLERSGTGESTYFPKALVREPPNPCLKEARKEAEEVMFTIVDRVLEKTGVDCKEIGIVVVNCSLFNSAPCLLDMIVNKYKLGDGVMCYNLGGMGCGDGVMCYNLGGMGCGAGLLAIGLAKQLLQVHRDTYALVVSTENITLNCYGGTSHSMLLVNSLFRVGGAAILLSNRPSVRPTSKYQLLHTVHTHTARSDRSYDCIHQEEDEDGIVGVKITKDLMIVAIKAIEANVMALGRLVLPLSEQITFLTNYLTRSLRVVKMDPYVPNFRNVFDHFFPHVGGKPVLDELKNNLGFSEEQMEASRMTLYRFGNTSSSSIWYELAYAEAKGRIKKGDRIWQIAFGAGFKCNSSVLRAIKTVGFDENNVWNDDIDAFPVDLSNIGKVPYYFEPSKSK